MKLLIVDDERHVRVLLNKVIDIAALGVAELLEAGSTAEALRIIDEERPSIILTDMHMPEHDGTHLIKAMAAYAYPYKLIVISAHDDFAYMQSAVRGGSFDYLMKPIDERELNRCLGRAARQLLEEREKSSHAVASQQRLNETLGLYWDSLLTQCMYNGSMLKQHAGKLQEMVGFRPAMTYCLVGLHVDLRAQGLRDRFGHRRDLFNYAVLNIANETIRSPDRAIAFRNVREEGVIVLVVAHTEKAASYAESIIRFVKERFAVPVSAYMSDTAAFPDRVEQLYQQTEHIAQSVNLLHMHACHVYRMEDAVQCGLVSLLADKSRLLLIIRYGDLAGLECYVEKLIQSVAASGVLQRKQLLLWERELDNVKEQLLVEHNNVAGLDDGAASLTYQALQGALEPERLQQEIVSYLHSIQMRTSKRHGGKQRELLDHIKQVMDDNESFTLNLNMLAEDVHYSADYLSRTFKSQYGVSIKDYMNQKRIAYACELLKNTDYKITEVSERLHFADEKHFSKAFKKSMGQSPSQYRHKLSAENS